MARHRSQYEELYCISDELLGRGAFGRVVCAKRVDTGDEVACKLLLKQGLQKDSEAIELLHNEMAVWEFLDHPHLVKLHDVFEDPTHVRC